MDNLKKAISKAKPGGDAVPVLDENGKTIGYCGILETVGIHTPNKIPNSIGGLKKCLEAIDREKGK